MSSYYFHLVHQSTHTGVLSGPQPSSSGVLVNVSCTSPTTFASRQDIIALSVAFTGGNGCPSGTLERQAVVVVAGPVTPTPAITVSPSPASPPPACRAAQAGQSINITTSFAYAVTASGSGLLSIFPSVSSSPPTGLCTATAPAGE